MVATSVEIERKRQKQKQIQKTKQLKLVERTERLSKTSIQSLQSKIDILEKRNAEGNLNSGNKATLESLKSDLVFMEKNDLGTTIGTDDSHLPTELGTKSIFFDPEWNPKGIAPRGHKNIPYNPFTFKPKEAGKGQANEVEIEGIEDIPLPLAKT